MDSDDPRIKEIDTLVIEPKSNLVKVSKIFTYFFRKPISRIIMAGPAIFPAALFTMEKGYHALNKAFSSKKRIGSTELENLKTCKDIDETLKYLSGEYKKYTSILDDLKNDESKKQNIGTYKFMSTINFLQKIRILYNVCFNNYKKNKNDTEKILKMYGIVLNEVITNISYILNLNDNANDHLGVMFNEYFLFDICMITLIHTRLDLYELEKIVKDDEYENLIKKYKKDIEKCIKNVISLIKSKPYEMYQGKIKPLVQEQIINKTKLMDSIIKGEVVGEGTFVEEESTSSTNASSTDASSTDASSTGASATDASVTGGKTRKRSSKKSRKSRKMRKSRTCDRK